MPVFIQKLLRKEPATIDLFAAHQINQQVCHAFLKRHQLKGLKISIVCLSRIQPCNVLIDPDCQQNIPDLDGGEGCSEYIIHGTNVDISEPTDGNTAEDAGGTDESQPLSGTTESSADREDECDR